MAALDRRLQFMRAEVVDDGFSQSPGEFAPLGRPVWASRADVSDGEKVRAMAVAFDLSVRFLVRWSNFTRSILPTDKLESDGRLFEIVGIKETGGRRRWLEISAKEIGAAP